MVISCYHDITPASYDVVGLHDGLTRIDMLNILQVLSR